MKRQLDRVVWVLFLLGPLVSCSSSNRSTGSADAGEIAEDSPGGDASAGDTSRPRPDVSHPQPEDADLDASADLDARADVDASPDLGTADSALHDTAPQEEDTLSPPVDSATPCGGGQYLLQGQCVEVGEGYYSPAEDDGRYVCAAGSYSARPDESAPACTPCPLPAGADRDHTTFASWGNTLPASRSGDGCQVETLVCESRYYATTLEPRRCIAPADHLRAMTWNIRQGVGARSAGDSQPYTDPRHISAIVTAIGQVNPDVLALQEVSINSQLRPFPGQNQGEVIRAQLNELLPAAEQYPYLEYSTYSLWGYLHGNVIISRFPLSNVHVTDMTDAWPRSHYDEGELEVRYGGLPLLDAVVTPSGGVPRRFAFFSCHFPTYQTTPEGLARRGQPAFDVIIKRMIPDYDDGNVPVLVAGDLNTRHDDYELSIPVCTSTAYSPPSVLHTCRHFDFNPVAFPTSGLSDGVYTYQLDYIGVDGEAKYQVDRWYVPEIDGFDWLDASDHKPLVMDMLYEG